jgi:hypothetical protein
MVEIAKILSKNIAFVRIDLFNIEGKIYFSENNAYSRSRVYTFFAGRKRNRDWKLYRFKESST